MDENMNNDEVRDTVEFVSDTGAKIELEVVEYFLYDGDEYVILADLGGDPDALTNGDKVDVFIMMVNMIDEQNEEFVMIPQEKEDEVLHFASHLLGNDDDHDHEHGHDHHHGEELV
jgi:hypothetical protein